MDKISAVLISGIIILVAVSGIIVYDTWVSDDMNTIEAETVVQETSSGDELAFNDDTSVKNNSSRELWIRVKPVYDSGYDDKDYKIISAAIDEGKWQSGGESWYYYSEPLGLNQVTEPLIDRLLYNGEDVSQGGGGSFSLQIEAVDEEWFVRQPSDGVEAFEFFEETIAIPDGTYL